MLRKQYLLNDERKDNYTEIQWFNFKNFGVPQNKNE